MQTQAATADDAKPSSRRAPGPKGNLITGVLTELRSAKLKTLINLVQTYGDVVRMPVVIDMYLVTHPDHVKYVMQDNHPNYTKGFNYVRMEPFLGKGLLTSEGEEHLRNRRLAQPAFHRQRIAGFADLMAGHTARMLAGWEPGAKLDVHHEMMKLTLAVVGDALFSTDISQSAEEVGRALSDVLEITNHRFESIFVPPKFFPTPMNLRFNRSLDVLDTLVNGLISARRKNPEVKNDLLAMLMEARTEDGKDGMSDRQLRDEVMTMVLAGHETTANALTWAFYLLSTHPEVERRLATEVAQLEGRAPTLADLPKLPYTKQVMEETMRLYPPAWAVGRQTIEDDEIGGYRIPKKTDVMLFPFMTHRDPRFWDNPEGFDPDRFLPENAAKRHKFAFFPFAAGPRMCIGSAFAMMEMQLVLAMVVQRFRVDLVPGQVVIPEPRVTLRPKDGLKVSLKNRL
jgi:cytochrome P450